MAALTVADLLARVREKTDEDNTESVSDVSILRSLNEAQRALVRIAARQYDQVFIDSTDLTTDGTDRITIPEDAFDRRVEFVEVSIGSGRWRKLIKEKPSKVNNYHRGSNVQWPSAYTTRRNEIMLLPSPVSGATVRVWYTKRPGDLVQSQGRIVDYSTANDTITVDTLGSDISTTVDDLGAFINVVDGTTGLVKGSYQISAIDTTTKVVSLKTSSLDRATVAGKTIGTALATTVEKDDYICAISGTCVLELLADYSDYLAQYSVVDIRRSLREDTSPDYAHLKDLERELETIWSGRDQDARVAAKNPHWGSRRLTRRR